MLGLILVSLSRFICEVSEILVFISSQNFPKSGKHVADSGLVPPAGRSCTSCALDSSFISAE